MNFGQAESAMNILQLGLFTKLFFSVAAIFYTVFAAVIYRQVSLMTQVLETKISPTVKMIALAQIAAAGVLVLLAIFLA